MFERLTYRTVGFAIMLAANGLFAMGCTTPGQTTQIGATTGGVLGAGVGALIGSQSGSAGEGLLVGSLAGAAAGAAIGNALEAHEEQFIRQDLALERQQQMINAQQREIDELRRLRMSDEGIANRRLREQDLKRSQNDIRSRHAAASSVNSAGNAKLRERTLIIEQKDRLNKASDSKIASNKPVINTDDCQKAEMEAARAESSEDVSDKMLYLRRALRLCPTNPEFHNALGEVYLAVNRIEDAKFEFNEALRFDPNFERARRNLKQID